jgi:hypothetical protein
MRATTASTVMTLVLLAGCFELPARVKDSALDDTATTSSGCPPDSVSRSMSSVTVLDLVVNGRRISPTPAILCVFAGGYGARLGLASGEEFGVVTVQSEELGAWGVPDPDTVVSVFWEDITWAASDFYTGSVVISPASGGDSGLGDTNGGGGAYVGLNGEATNADAQQLILNVSWEG